MPRQEWSLVVSLHEHDRADHRREQQHRRDLERERVIAEDARRERREVAAARHRLARVTEREREEGDEDPDRRDEERGPRSLSLKEQPVGTVALRREHHPVQDQDGDRAYVNEHLERGDRLGPEEHEHPGHAEERERHEQRGAGDAVQEHDARGAADDADGEKREQDRADAVVGHGWPAGINGARCAASRARSVARRRRCRYGTSAATPRSISQFAIATWMWLCGNARSSTAVTMRFVSVTGMSSFQQSDMSWSMRKRGSVARIHMKTSTRKYVFSVNQRTPSAGPISGWMSVKGPCQPPSQSVVTIPDTASGRSNGFLFVSANPAMKYVTKAKGRIRRLMPKSGWLSTIFVVESDPTRSTTVTSERICGTSYEMS